MAARLAGGALLALMGLSSPGQAFFAANMVAFQDVAGSAASVSLRDSALSPSGLAFNQRLRAIKGLADRDGAGILSFYSARDFRPAWTLDGKLTDAAKAVMARILAAEDEGLDPKAFAVPPLDLNESGPDAVIEAEIKLSLAVITYAKQAQIGRVTPSSIDENIGYEPVAPDPATSLASVFAAADPSGALAAFNPPHEGYRQLRAELAKMRAAGIPSTPEPIAAGATLKVGMSDPRVPRLRARLDLPANDSAPEIYDAALAEAVKAFQKSREISPTGQLTPITVSVLNRLLVDQHGELIANMERWRWLPRDLGRFHVMVDIPGYVLRVFKDGAMSFTTRIVVGKPENATPIFSDQIETVVVNPYWNVPVSITTKEMLPAILKDPTYLARQNYEVLANVAGRYQIVDPRQIDWKNSDIRRVQIRQRPGDLNALGNIKFLFPNKYDVYLHDTPSKSLFARDQRAFSHGCMRVMDPFAFAEALLSEDRELNAAKLKKLVGGSEQQMNMSKVVPVHITYFTAHVNDLGKLEYREDIYGHSVKVRKALGI